ncbi:MAG: hypothetical protein WCR52_01415 [Bacteroidota bacterium]
MPKKIKDQVDEIHSNKVYLVLCRLDSAAHKRLSRFLQSPYFNQGRTLPRLYKLLVECVEQGKPGFNRQIIWRKLFGETPYDDTNFRKYCSDLLKSIEAFMAAESQADSVEVQAMATLEYVVRHKVEPLFSTAFRQAKSSLAQKKYRTVDYFYYAYAAERQYYRMMDFDVKLDVRANIEEISKNLDLFYWIEKLKLYIAVLSQRKTGMHQYTLDFMAEIVLHLQNFPLDDAPELALYYYSFLTLYDAENVEHYYKLRSLLDVYGAEMPQQEAVELFDSALHYCTGKLNQGNRVFLQEYFDLFEDAVRKEVFIVNGELASWRLNNSVGVALRLGKLDWAENFIESHKQYLSPDTRINTYTFNLARVYRYKKQYHKVLDLLRNIEYEDIGYNLISKAMLTITYYELEELDALDSMLESFRVFLNRHKNIPQQTRVIYQNLIKYTRKLMRMVPGDKKAIAALQEEITREKAYTVNHEWLLEKLDEL